MKDEKIYEMITDELFTNDDRSEFVDTTNEREFFAMKIAALKQQRRIIDLEIKDMEQLLSLSIVV
ncbi:MAG: hypothetical protein LBO68_05475 [Synergistaceae bacterium]|jgi:chaperonin cofactor prefoldin|nr:hypothetical protein [Synergistaceae bacterium]